MSLLRSHVLSEAFPDRSVECGASSSPHTHSPPLRRLLSCASILFSSTVFIIQWYSVHLCLVAQSCPTLCDPLDYSPPGSSVRGILQARILQWVAISSSRGSSRSRELNLPLLCLRHCRQILYLLSHQGSPVLFIAVLLRFFLAKM